MTAPGPRGLGERWRAAAEDASLLVHGLVAGVFFATIRFAVPGSTASGHVVRALVEGAAFGALMAAFVGAQRRGDLEAMGPAAALDRTIAARVVRTGGLPESRARDEQVRRLLDRRRRQCRRDGPVTAVLLGTFSAVHLALALAADDPVWVVAAVGGLVLAVAVLAWSRRVLARYHRIEEALTRREESGRG